MITPVKDLVARIDPKKFDMILIRNVEDSFITEDLKKEAGEQWIAIGSKVIDSDKNGRIFLIRAWRKS